MVCRLNARQYGVFFMELLRDLIAVGAGQAGDKIVDRLASEQSGATVWPSDEDLRDAVGVARTGRLLLRGQAVVTDTEEARVEFGGGGHGSRFHVAELDRGVLGAVPAVLAPLLEEVGIGLRAAENGADCVQRVGNAESVGGLFDGERGGILVERSNLDEAEEPLGVTLGATGEGRELGKTGSHQGYRELKLSCPVECGDHQIRLAIIQGGFDVDPCVVKGDP